MENYKQKNKFNFYNLYVNIENDKGYCEKKRGKKPKYTENKGKHNKESSDNIIKKIKAKIFKYPISFLNKISNKDNEDKKNQILKLDYKFVDRIKRDLDLKYLNNPLKDVFSMDITPKYKNIVKDSKKSNKIIIENILNKEADDTITFAFNITLRDWFDLFTYKKNINDIMNSYDLTNYKGINTKNIEDCMIGVDDLLNKMVKENDINYFSYFIFYLYNYKRWFYLKKGRNRNINKNK